MAEDQDKLRYVDALRGIAVLMVLLIHTSTAVPGLDGLTLLICSYGQMGVQLFFVVSAYTLCRSHRRRAGERAALAAFYVRRYFRIAPLYYVGIAMYFFIVVVLGVGNPNQQALYDWTNSASNILLIHGFVRPAFNSVVPGGWSIGTEMAFYLAFPLIFSIMSSAWMKGRAVFLLVACIPFVFDLALMMLLSRLDMVSKGEYSMPNNAFLYCNLVNQLPVFMFGIGLYFLEDGGYLRPGRWRVPCLFAALLLSVIGLVLLHGDRGLTFVILPTIAGASFACLFVAVRGMTSIPAWLCRIGQVSYSIYIFHFIFASFLASRILKMLGLGGGLVLIVTWIVVIGCTYVVASRTEHLIEAHGIDLGRRIIRRLQRREASPITIAS